MKKKSNPIKVIKATTKQLPVPGPITIIEAYNEANYNSIN
jgi:hypothetical protein